LKSGAREWFAVARIKNICEGNSARARPDFSVATMNALRYPQRPPQELTMANRSLFERVREYLDFEFMTGGTALALIALACICIVLLLLSRLWWHAEITNGLARRSDFKSPRGWREGRGGGTW
jgi:hypothetical protein